jgi:hypothetical protein
MEMLIRHGTLNGPKSQRKRLGKATPVHEAAARQTDLRGAHIEPFAWALNQSFAEIGSRDPLLVTRWNNEIQFIRDVVEKLSQKTALVPGVTEEPEGPERLQQLLQTFSNRKLQLKGRLTFAKQSATVSQL